MNDEGFHIKELYSQEIFQIIYCECSMDGPCIYKLRDVMELPNFRMWNIIKNEFFPPSEKQWYLWIQSFRWPIQTTKKLLEKLNFI